MPKNRRRNHPSAAGRREDRIFPASVEPLEGRTLQTTVSPYFYSYPSYSTPAATSPVPAQSAASGLPSPAHAQSSRAAQVAVNIPKKPKFYPAYTGPRLAELDAARASGTLLTNGDFVFTGTNKGPINQAPAVYVWGIDRSGHLPAGPFQNRPNIKFDAVVVVTVGPSLIPSASVVDTTTGTSTGLTAGSATIRGNTVSVTVPGHLLPSTGLPASRYRFNYWPEDGDTPGSSSIASFLPEASTARVGSG